jgi:hypothetical protein
MGQLRSESRVTTVNTAVKGYARMYNFMGSASECQPFARMFLVLRRTMDRNGVPAQFEIVPFVSRSYESPPGYLSCYLESEKPDRYASSHVWDIGFIREPTMLNVPEGIREMSIGLDASERVASQTMPSLPQIVVELGL